MQDIQQPNLSPNDNSNTQQVVGGGINPPPTSPENNKPHSKIPKKPIIVVVSLFVVVLIFAVAYLTISKLTLPSGPFPQTTSTESVEKFTSNEEFKQYLTEGESLISSSFGGISRGNQLNMALESATFDSGTIGAPMMGLSGGEPSRVSETNVQVVGIDEPDIVKTDGKQIYLSTTQRYRGRIEPVLFDDAGRLPPEPIKAETKIIDAFPPSELEQISGIEKTGSLLLTNDNLVVFSGNDVYGYDVSDPSSPTEKWNFELDSRTSIVSSRLSDDKVYIITRTSVSSSQPCPIPLISEPTGLVIPCTDIYHPTSNIPVDSTYTVLAIDPSSGEVEDKVSFVGSSGLTTVYMSPDAIYITYPITGNPADFFYTFFTQDASDLVPAEIGQKLNNLKDLDISSAAKFVELETILENHYNSLDDDERLRIENELANRLQDFSSEHAREYEKTGIVKIDSSSLNVESVGEVPGSPLNQFSLDEYKGNLRIATTLGRGMFNIGESANDVYVLDKNLKTTGQVQNLGLTERIYSVRFIEDKGYVVTFRQVDPFYVIDLSDPNNPQVKGELKIPGFSSYLHPINKDKILGVGEESGKVKISLFDVSNASDPREISKYQLDEYYSDVQNTHHAFLLDPDNKIFFIPGSKGGYIFSYAGDELKLERVVSDISARRAIYLDNYLYVIGDDKIVVLNEADWQEVNSLELQ